MTLEISIMLAIFIVPFLSLPLIMLLLERKGIFTAHSYLVKWKAAILVIAIVSMILSPGGDPVSMMLLLALLAASYFTGAWLCKRMAKGRQIPLT